MVVSNLDLLERTLIAGLPADRRPTEAEALALATSLRLAFPVPDEAFAGLIKQVHAKLAITMDLGTFLTESTHSPWLAVRKADIDPYYWERYRQWLGRLGWAPLVVNTLMASPTPSSTL